MNATYYIWLVCSKSVDLDSLIGSPGGKEERGLIACPLCFVNSHNPCFSLCVSMARSQSLLRLDRQLDDGRISNAYFVCIFRGLTTIPTSIESPARWWKDSKRLLYFGPIQSKVIGKLTAFVSSLTFLSGKWGGIFHDNRVLELSKGKFGLRMVKQFLVLIELKLSS